ncbi:MAG: hypothetical protein KF681_12030 [Bdellovibrionaceae bacterium]|nr:hypothetical protein [Pseudobdellovibrionaceae bacterium]
MKHSFILFLFIFGLSLKTIAEEPPGQAPPAPATQPQAGNDTPAGGTPRATDPTPTGTAAQQKAMEENKQLTEAEASKSKLTEGTKGCEEAITAAKTACVEDFSPFLQAAMQGLTAAMAAQQGAAGASGQCQQAQQAQQPAQQNMQKYNADCAAKKTACEQKCGQAATGADTVSTSTCEADAKKSAPTDQAKQQMIKAKCTKAAQANKQANEQGKASCAKLSQNQAGGMAGIGELLKGLMKSGQCQQEVAVDCSKNPTAQGCPQALDCNKAENAANPRCICEKNPRAPGCGGQAESAPITDPTRDDNQTTGANDGSLGSPTDGTPAKYGSDSPAAGGGLPASPGGGGGGGGLGKGGELADKGEKPKGIDTNVLGEGGGGGGGASATSNGLAASDDPTGKYGKYLPEDPARKPTALADQVSGAAGLSNWEKIRKRYSENRPSLLRP